MSQYLIAVTLTELYINLELAKHISMQRTVRSETADGERTWLSLSNNFQAAVLYLILARK